MRIFRSFPASIAVLVLAVLPLAARADGLVNRSATSLGLCYGSGSSGALVPCVLTGNTWTRVYKPGDDASFQTVTAGTVAATLTPQSIAASAAQLPACTVGSTVAPVPAGQPFLCGGIVMIAQ